MSISIVYWSGSGNTRLMAEALADGASAAGGAVELKEVASTHCDTVLKAKAIALGCPAMGQEVLEEDQMEPFVQELETRGLAGKKVLLFGSYDWGDGEWMRVWEARMEKAGATLVSTGIIAQNEPGPGDLDRLRELGRNMVTA